MSTLPSVLEPFRTCPARDVRSLSINGLVKLITMPALDEIATELEGASADHANTTAFRLLCLRLLARLTVYRSFTRKPVNAEFWETVIRSEHSSFRAAAILACNLSTDDRLWHCLKAAWREDTNGLNRTLALETLGTCVSSNRDRVSHAMEEFHEGVSRDDRWTRLGAVYGSLFVKQASGDAIAMKIVKEESDGYLVATAFAVLWKRQPKRAQKIFAAILGYILQRQPSLKTATALLGVCRIINPTGTRRVCLRAIEEPAEGRRKLLRSAALNFALASGLSTGVR